MDKKNISVVNDSRNIFLRNIHIQFILSFSIRLVKLLILNKRCNKKSKFLKYVTWETDKNCL